MLYIIAGLVFVACVTCLAIMAVYEKPLNARQDTLTALAEVPSVLGVSTSIKHAAAAPIAWAVVKPFITTDAQPQQPAVNAIYHIATSQPVIFITIDDGVYPNEAALTLMRQRGVVASLFLNDAAVRSHYDYFKRWQQAGSTVQNHTVDHPNMKKLPLDRQKQEICDDSTLLHAGLDANPTLFRPPYGDYNDATRQAVAQCGLKALVWWTASVGGGIVHYQTTDHLNPGDIVLLHFLPSLDKDLTALFAEADARGLKIGRLEDWLH